MSDSIDGLPTSYRPEGISDKEWLGEYPKIVDELVEGYDKYFKTQLMRGDDIAHYVAAAAMMRAGTSTELIGEKAWLNSQERSVGLWQGEPNAMMIEVKILHNRILNDRSVRDPFIND